MQQSVELEPLLTSREAWEYLRCSRSTLIRLREQGQITGHKVGARWRFKQSELKQAVRDVAQPEQGEQ